MRKNKFFKIGVSIVIIFSFVGCPKSKDSKANTAQQAIGKPRTHLVLATNSEPDTLNPMFAEMGASHEVTFLGHRELTMYNDKWELVPDLAVSVPSLKNGQVKLVDIPGTKKQKMQVTWQLKADAQWEDGTPVTGEDIQFAHTICLDKTQEIIDRDTCERIESIQIVSKDKKQFVVTWKEPFAFYNIYGVHALMPKHYLKNRYYAPGGRTRDLKRDPYGKKPLSNGPFKFKEWVPGQHITYVRNPNYKPLAKVEEVTIRIIPNNMSIESNLVAGDVDGVIPAGGLTVPQIEGLKKREGKNLVYISAPGMIWAHIDFNLDDPILADVRVRRGIAHAINRDQVIKTIYHGQYQAANSFLPPRHWGYDPSIPYIPFDMKKAADLFAQAGWKRISESGPLMKEGQKMVLNLSAVGGIRDIEQFEQVVQTNLRRLGAELRVSNKPAKVFFGDFARHRKFPQMSFYSWISSPGGWSSTLWHQDMIPSKENSWQGQNYPGWRSPEASKLLDQIPTILDEKRRKGMMSRVQKLWYKDLPTVPVYFRPVVAVTKPYLSNFKPTGTLTPSSWNAAEWELKPVAG